MIGIILMCMFKITLFSFLFDDSYGESVERMSVEEFEQGKRWLSDTFQLIR